MESSIVEQLAANLLEADSTKQAIPAPSGIYPDFSLEDAYAVQDATIVAKTKNDPIAGYKIGLTSQQLQRAWGTKEPILGRIMRSTIHSTACELQFSSFIKPKIEVELAFVLKTPLMGTNLNLFDVIRAVEYVVPAFELVDNRVAPEAGKSMHLADLICDNSCNAGAVLGLCPFAPDRTDLRWISAICYRNGMIEDTGVAAAVLDHPAAGIAWLAKKLAPHRVNIPAGSIILGGTFMNPLTIDKGDTIQADYGPFGSVSCHFV